MCDVISLIKDKANIYKIFGLPVFSTSAGKLVECLIKNINSHNKLLLAFANAHTMNLVYTDDLYRQTLKSFVVVNDGIGVDIAAKILYKNSFLENLNGTDFMPVLFSALPDKTRLYFLGSTEENIRVVEKKFEINYPNLNLVGVNHGYFKDTEQILEKINAVSPHIVVVGFGNPKQEIWIEKNYQGIDASIFIGVGAFFDFYSNNIVRAPLLVRKLRFEWLFRLILEPRRLWKRYIIGNITFLVRVLKQKYS